MVKLTPLSLLWLYDNWKKQYVTKLVDRWMSQHHFYHLQSSNCLCSSVDFKKEDMAKALVKLMSGDIAQLTYWISNANKCQRIFFCGGFFNHPMLQEEIIKIFFSHTLFAIGSQEVSRCVMKHDQLMVLLGSMNVANQ